MDDQTDSRTLWIGDLAYWMDESLLYSLFASTNAVVSVKIIRNKATNLSEGYGFVEFRTHEAAEQVRFDLPHQSTRPQGASAQLCTMSSNWQFAHFASCC